jgi:hypothetical protein
MKKGQPINAVNMPTGISPELIMVRASVSHKINTMAPVRAEAGMRILWSGPTSNLTLKWKR